MIKNFTGEQIDKTGSISDAQKDMCKSYANGSIGIIVSWLIWLISAFVAYQNTPKQAIWTLLIGGVFIAPLSAMLSKALGLTGAHTKGNPLANLAMEGTIFMIMCLPLAFGLSLQHNEWFFQSMLLIIGGRYLTFASIYGNRGYWILGAVLGIAAYLLFRFKIQPFGSALTGALIEISFGLFMFVSFRRNKS